jgi:hypothetical protein
MAVRNLKQDLPSLNKRIQRRIRDGKDRDGKAFAPLKSFTIGQRSQKSLHPSTSPDKSNLTETGRMVNDTEVRAIGPGKLQLGVAPRSQDKARNHMQGKTSTGRKMAVRPFLGLTRDEKRHLRKLVRAALVRGFK